MSTEVKIRDIAFVFHPVADMERAREFYGTLLGLNILLEVQVSPGMWWVEYNIAGAALAVSNMSAPLGSSGAALALEVEDLDACVAAMSGAKVPLTIEPQDFPTCRMFGINTPDGHSIMFHQHKA